MRRRLQFAAALAAAAMSVTGGFVSAQSVFPVRPAHILVPYAAGGGVDTLARTLCPGSGAKQWW